MYLNKILLKIIYTKYCKQILFKESFFCYNALLIKKCINVLLLKMF